MATVSITDSTIPSWLDSANRDLASIGKNLFEQPYQPYTGQRIAPASPLQTQAADFLTSNAFTRGPAYTNATNTATGLSNFTAPTVGSHAAAAPGRVDYDRITAPGMVNWERLNAPDAAAWERIDPAAGNQAVRTMEAAPDIGAWLFTDAAKNIDQYMNPYTQAALNPTLREMATQNAGLQNDINARAAAGGAFGGSRHGIINAEQNRNYGQAVGDVTSRAYSDAFEKARQSIFQDIQNKFAADVSNQNIRQRTGEANLSAGVTADTANANRLIQAMMANQSTGFQSNALRNQQLLQAGMANQQTGYNAGALNAQQQLAAAQSNQSAGVQTGIAGLNAQTQTNLANLNAALQADMANQNASIASGNLSLNAARALEDMGYRNRESMLGAAQDMYGMGLQDRAIGQANLDTQYQDFLRQQQYPMDRANQYASLVRGAPAPVSTTRTGPEPNWWAQVLGAGLTGAGIASRI